MLSILDLHSPSQFIDNMPAILIPNYENIDEILALNSKYLATHLSEKQRQGGFIRIEYSNNELRKIVEAKEIVIASDNGRVIGYYLIGRKSDNLALNYQKNKALSLFDTRSIKFNNIGYGCQVCIGEEYRNNGIFRKMLSTLTDLVKDKYSHLLCSISDDNVVSLRTHMNNGWQPIDDFETKSFFIYQTLKPTL